MILKQNGNEVYLPLNWGEDRLLYNSKTIFVLSLRDFGGISSLTTHLFLITLPTITRPKTGKAGTQYNFGTCRPSDVWPVHFCATGRVIAFPLSPSMELSSFFLIALKKSYFFSCFGTWSIYLRDDENNNIKRSKRETARTTKDKT